MCLEEKLFAGKMNSWCRWLETIGLDYQDVLSFHVRVTETDDIALRRHLISGEAQPHEIRCVLVWATATKDGVVS